MKKTYKSNIRITIKLLIFLLVILLSSLIFLSIFLFYQTKVNFFNNILKYGSKQIFIILQDFNSMINSIFILNLILTSILAIIISFLFSTIRSYVKDHLNDINDSSFLDPLTSLQNRKSFLNSLFFEMKRASRNNYSIFIILGNIDDFSAINREYGTDIGDIVLKDISSIIRTTVRRHDLVCRWKEDYFMIMLPETDIKGGEITAEKIRKKIVDHDVFIKNLTINVTMSFGTSIIEANSPGFSSAIKQAEQQLEIAKKTGKNIIR